MIGVAATQLAVGILLLYVRLSAEHKVAAITRTLAATNDRLERLNRIDPLTGLANRRHLDEVPAVEWAGAEEGERQLGMIMIDIDHFKQYNDTYGHPGGDGCLRKVTGAVLDGLRDTDLAVRYGGEEVLVLLPDTDLETTEEVAARIQANVAALQEEHVSSPFGIVSVSMGIAAACTTGDLDARALVQRADQGLYQAKRDGRNRIGVAEETARGR